MRSSSQSGAHAPTRRLILTTLLSLIAILALGASTASAALPDNRAYELVSPAEKNPYDIQPNFAIPSASGEQAIVSGGAANATLSVGGSLMLETRDEHGWEGVSLDPSPTGGANREAQSNTGLVGVGEENDVFSRFAFGTEIGLEEERDREGRDVYVRDGASGPFAWISGPPAPALKDEPCPQYEQHLNDCDAVFAGASKTLNDVVWSQTSALLEPPAGLPGQPADTHTAGDEVYESVEGAGDQLVGQVPASGSESQCGPGHASCVVPPCGAEMGNAHPKAEVEANFKGMSAPQAVQTVQGAVSGDGSQVVFVSPDPTAYCGPPPELYLREDGSRTVDLSASQRAVPDPKGPQAKIFVGSAEANGKLTTVFFISHEELTNDANTGGAGNEDQGNDLYAYDLQTGRLTDLTASSDPANPFGGNVDAFVGSFTEGSLAEGSLAEGSLVYFTATGVLTKTPNGQDETAQPGVSNLYVDRYDATTEQWEATFIAPGARVGDAQSGEVTLGYSLTPDGHHLLFVDTEPLTGYDNIGPCAVFINQVTHINERVPAPCAEVYLYEATANGLACVSCNPTGAPAAGNAALAGGAENGDVDVESAVSPRLTMSDDGSRVFFTSPDRLTPAAPPPTVSEDVDLAQKQEFEPNVYEYEHGQLQLIAPAASLQATTATGDDVFFDTRAQLVPQDRNGELDIYDARVDGGFPTIAPPACQGTACQGNPAPAPIFSTPSSVTFNGVGNFPPPSSSPPPAVKPKTKTLKCAKGLTKKKSKCVRSKGKKKAKRASRNRRTKS